MKQASALGKSILCAAGLVALVSAGAAAQEGGSWPPPGVSFHGDPASPDLSGLWLGTAMGVPGAGAVTNSGATSDGRAPTYWAPWPLPYTPAYQKTYDDRVAAAKAGRQRGETGSRCRPFGLPFMLSSKVYPDEIVQTPGARSRSSGGAVSQS